MRKKLSILEENEKTPRIFVLSHGEIMALKRFRTLGNPEEFMFNYEADKNIQEIKTESRNLPLIKNLEVLTSIEREIDIILDAVRNSNFNL